MRISIRNADERFPTGFYMVLLAMIAVTVWAFSFWGYNASRLFLVMFILLAFLVDIEWVFYLYIFCFPFSSILKLSETSISVLPFLCVIVVIRLLWSKQVAFTMVQILSLAAWILLQFASAIFYNANLASIISLFLSVVFVLCGASYFSRQQGTGRKTYHNAVIFYATAIIACIALSDLFPGMMYTISAQKQAALAIAGRFGATFVEPNEFAQAVLIGMGLLVSIFSAVKKIFWKVTVVGAIIYFGISGYRTISKSYALTLLGLFAVLMLMYLYRTAKNRGLGIAVLKLLPIVCILVFGMSAIYEEVVYPIFEERSETDFLTGRSEIWKWYIDALFERPDILLWGCGAGNATYLSKVNSQIGRAVPHNTYLEYLVQFGIVGCVLFGTAISKIFKQDEYKRSVYFVLAICAFLTTAIGISANSNDCVFVILLLAAMPCAAQKTADA